jgi:hypothetical protein
MVNWLAHLVQNPDIPAGICSGSEHRFPEILSRHYLGT